jgi:glucan 1,3-beta-glucosidase
MSRWFFNLLAANAMFTFFTFVLASNGLLTDLLGTGTAHNDEPFWLEKIKHQGISPFNPNTTEYKVFRNVKVSRIICVLFLCSSILSGLWRNW